MLEHLDFESFLKFTANPKDTQAIFDIQKKLITAPNRAEMIDHLYKTISANQEFVALYNEKYIPKFPSTEELLSYAEGTYGRAVGDHLKTNGIELDFAGVDISVFMNQEMNLMGYMSIRGIRTHDLFHVALGLGTSPIEEYALASFTLAQYGSPYHMILVASGYLNTVFTDPTAIPKFLSETHRFFELGKKAKPFIGFRFEDHFATDLEEMREMLGIGQV